ncbi:hypothetical protein [Nonlabens agnitus]|uniref:Uncharacterized protein n=1 Tax=Nonlabens agnitus TaxID=870484 RepID=A0A2S9WSB8_9FLAO|nr:hypothetical protein [Nonlabens agnitus]PRP66370.1 hypothetical protein BST86_04330 [Nonlabens agnitus]
MRKLIQQKSVIIIGTIILLGLSYSCGNSKEQESDSLLEYTEDDLENSSSEVAKVYTFNQDCKATIENMDFSSLCFSDEKTPAYKIGEMSNFGNRCQFELADGQLRFALVYRDYSEVAPDEVAMANQAFQQSHQKTAEMMYKKLNSVKDLGDYAFIGADSIDNSDEKVLEILVSNVLISIAADPEYCGFSDEELIKLGRILTAYVKK